MVWLGPYAWGSPDRTHSPRRFTTPAVARELAGLIGDDVLQSSRAKEASPPLETCPVSGHLLHFGIDAGELVWCASMRPAHIDDWSRSYDKFQTDLTCPTWVARWSSGPALMARLQAAPHTGYARRHSTWVANAHPREQVALPRTRI